MTCAYRRRPRDNLSRLFKSAPCFQLGDIADFIVQIQWPVSNTKWLHFCFIGFKINFDLLINKSLFETLQKSCFNLSSDSWKIISLVFVKTECSNWVYIRMSLSQGPLWQLKWPTSAICEVRWHDVTKFYSEASCKNFFYSKRKRGVSFKIYWWRQQLLIVTK